MTITKLLEQAFPEKTPQAIKVMEQGYAKIKVKLIKHLKDKKVNAEIIKIIEDFS